MESLMQYLIENWVVVVSTVAVLTLLIGGIVKFIQSPKTQKSERFRKWLLYAVTEAEKEMGDGTGELKLLKVYEEFIKRFPLLSIIIPFESFKDLVDQALKQMREMLSTNEELKEFVEHEDTPVIECAMCGSLTEDLDEHNGEVLCETCYNNNEEVIKHG